MHSNMPTQITVNSNAEVNVIQPKKLAAMATDGVHYR
jgi:hypothetical protein